MSNNTRTLLWILLGVAAALLVVLVGVVFFLRATTN
jgi:hypothetical protein